MQSLTFPRFGPPLLCSSNINTHKNHIYVMISFVEKIFQGCIYSTNISRSICWLTGLTNWVYGTEQLVGVALSALNRGLGWDGLHDSEKG